MDARAVRLLRRRPLPTYCLHHERLAAKLGEDAVRAGRYPRRHHARGETPVTIEEAMTTAGANGAITPAEVRPLLAKATAASLDEIQAALLDAAVGATRENWTTFTCPDCGKKHRAQVQILGLGHSGLMSNCIAWMAPARYRIRASVVTFGSRRPRRSGCRGGRCRRRFAKRGPRSPASGPIACCRSRPG